MCDGRYLDLGLGIVGYLIPVCVVAVVGSGIIKAAFVVDLRAPRCV